MIRSKWLYALLAATILLAVSQTPVQAASKSSISFLSAKLRFASEPMEVSALLAKPDGNGPFPAVVLLHTCGGMNSAVWEDWPQYLTGLGYVALAVDTFRSRKKDKCGEGASKEIVKKRAQEMTRDAYGGLKYLSSLPYIDQNNIAVMGFSFGANVINAFSTKPMLQKFLRQKIGINFKAGVVFYASCKNLNNVKSTPFPLIQIIGDKDKYADTCAQIGQGPIKVHLLPGAYHNFDEQDNSDRFDNAGNWRSYDKGATTKAREITRIFLADEFTKTGTAGGPKRPTFEKLIAMMDSNGDQQISKKRIPRPT